MLTAEQPGLQAFRAKPRSTVSRFVWATALILAWLLAGCENLRYWHGDETFNPEYVLKIEIPPSATGVEKQFDQAIAYDITFLMPDDQWRSYATQYYPDDELTAKPLVGEKLPPVCTARDGVALTQWSASGPIPYMASTEVTARRLFWAVPGCKPDQTFVRWFLVTPRATPASGTT